jgi:O-antigen/teichoic acid export membrane protein
MYDYKKILGNKLIIQSFVSIVLRVLGVITLFGFTIFLTHNYEAKIIGQFDFIKTFLFVVGSICVVGTDQSILYFYGILKSENELNNLKKIYLKIIKLIFSFCCCFLLILITIGDKLITIFFNDTEIYSIILKSSFILFFYCITIFNTEVFRSINSIYIAELYRNTFKYLSVFVGSYILLNVKKEIYLVDTFLIGFVILAITSTFIIINRLNKSCETQKNQILNVDISYKNILKKSYPIAISSMSIFLLSSFDIFFLKKYYGNNYVAFYGIAVKILLVIALIINTVNVAVSTKISVSFFSKNIFELRKNVKNSARLIFALTLPLSVIIIIFATEILSIFGSKYSISRIPLQILIIGQLLSSFFGNAAVYLNMTGRQTVFQNVLLLAVIINFFLNLFLVPQFGMIGASISFVTSTLFWNIITTIIVYKKDKILLIIH